MRVRPPILILAVLTVVLSGLAARAFVVQPMTVASSSMSPTLCQGDWVVVGVWDPVVSDLSRGDLVAVRVSGSDMPLVKRVAGLPGDWVSIEDALLVVNGQRVDEPYVDHEASDALYWGPVLVPDDAVIVLGDERATSIDSRDFGPVPGDGLVGEVVLRVRRGQC